jgi:hypothetical protein
MPIDFERQQFFWSRVRKDGEHLIWEGADTPRGYGKMQVGAEVVYAHRVAWCIAHNLDLKDIENKTIIRTCERNDCVEPEHLAARMKKSSKTA